MKKVLAIFGSPRKGENTDSALDGVLGALEGRAEIEKISLRKLTVKPCIACYKCAREKPCVLDDDMIDLYHKFDEADIILLSTPMTFTTVNAQTKALIDRLQAIYVSKYIRKAPIIDTLKKRAGYFVCTTGSKNPDTTGILMVADMFFKTVNTQHVGSLIFDDTDNNPSNRAPISNRARKRRRTRC